jgi:hypothetical protein
MPPVPALWPTLHRMASYARQSGGIRVTDIPVRELNESKVAKERERREPPINEKQTFCGLPKPRIATDERTVRRSQASLRNREESSLEGVRSGGRSQSHGRNGYRSHLCLHSWSIFEHQARPAQSAALHCRLWWLTPPGNEMVRRMQCITKQREVVIAYSAHY